MGLSCAGLVSVLAGLAGKVVVFQAVVVKTFVREMDGNGMEEWIFLWGGVSVL